MSRDRRMKAQDVFNSRDYMFGRKTSKFSEAFPEIKSVKVQLEELDFGSPLNTHYYTEHSLANLSIVQIPGVTTGTFGLASEIHDRSKRNNQGV